MDLGRLTARTVIGGLFVGHGTQKLLGWFNGPGLDSTTSMMEKLELRPARRNALAAGLSETVGGALLALGALTPLAGALLTGTMATAIRTVHLDKGLWNTDGGYEFNLALIGGIAALVETGPGSPSVDDVIGLRGGSRWTVAALAAGAAGSAATIALGRREAQRAAAEQMQPARSANGAAQQPVAVPS